MAKVDPFLKDKWERAFYTFFDTNRSKALEWDDFEDIIKRIKTLRGADNPIYKVAEDALHKVWNGMLKNAGKSSGQVITMDEWISMWTTNLKTPEAISGWQTDYLDYMFKLLDSSGDDLIDRGEYMDVMKSFDVPESNAGKAFDQFAFDDKGKPITGVNKQGFLKLWIEYFSSTDKKAHGNVVFGLMEK